uniref:UPF0380 proteins YafZ and homologs n=1 Tax=Klebsiella pneumoniae TaxID=573 RepID=A0A8B0SQC2_KLEPN|nr:UPF0380 proteins YafZ and homologs [Klebsiella pneumoniae]
MKVISGGGRFSRSPHKVKTAAPATQRVMVKKIKQVKENNMRLASRFGLTHSIRQERPLTNDELVKVVPSVFFRRKSIIHVVIAIPIFQPLHCWINYVKKVSSHFFACQSRVRDEDKRGHTKHMVRLRREGTNKGTEVPEIILLNSHDGSSSYQMIPGMFRFVCTNGLVCGTSFGEIRVPHKR